MGTREGGLVPRITEGRVPRAPVGARWGCELPNPAWGDVGAWGARVPEGRGRAPTNCGRRADEQPSVERPEGDRESARETRRGGEKSRTTGRARQVEGRKQGTPVPHHHHRSSRRFHREEAETGTGLPIHEDARGRTGSHASGYVGTFRGRVAFSAEWRPCFDPTETPSAAALVGRLENSGANR